MYSRVVPSTSMLNRPPPGDATPHPREGRGPLSPVVLVLVVTVSSLVPVGVLQVPLVVVLLLLVPVLVLVPLLLVLVLVLVPALTVPSPTVAPRVLSPASPEDDSGAAVDASWLSSWVSPSAREPPSSEGSGAVAHANAKEIRRTYRGRSIRAPQSGIAHEDDISFTLESSQGIRGFFFDASESLPR